MLSARLLGSDPSAHPLSGAVDQALMLAQAPAWALDVDDDRPVQQSVQDGRGDDRVAEQLAPGGQAAVGGDDGGRVVVVAAVDHMEQGGGGGAGPGGGGPGG